MDRRSKILARSSIFAFLAVGGGGAALGLAYSGELFALLPALSSVGVSTIGPALIAATALFVSLSLVLSISFLRSRHLEKKKSNEEINNSNIARYIGVNGRELRKEQEKIQNFSMDEKKEYFEEAITSFAKLGIQAIFQEKDKFKDIIIMYGYSHLVYYAASEGNYAAVKYMVEELEVNINEPFMGSIYSPIHYAIELNDTKALKCLIDNGADPAKTRFINQERAIVELERTPLMEAAYDLQKENVALLLSREEVKANINAVDSDEDTALMFVLSQNVENISYSKSQAKNEIVKLVLDNLSENTTTFTKEQKQAQHKVKLLLENFSEGVEHFTTEQKQAKHDIVKLLLENGADPTIKNNKDKTALDLAQQSNCDQRVVSLLKKAEKKWEKKHKDKESHVAKVTKTMQSEGPQK